MRRTLLMILMLLAGLVAGCGSDKDKGKNRDRDLPRTGEKSEKGG